MQNKAAIFGILLFVGATIIFFLGFSMLNGSRTQNKPRAYLVPTPSTVPTQSREGTTFANSPNNIYSPIAKNSKILVQTLIIYTFQGTLTSINQHPKGYELFTDIEEKNLPPFIVCLTCKVPTEVFFYNLTDDKRTLTTISSLKEKQKIYIVSSYNIRRQAWSTTRILILDSPTASATATPDPGSP